jgi:Flp pilus assembly CpaF family ATPase
MVSNLGAPDDRVLSLEASPELALASEFSTRLVASADVGLGRLLSHASRLRADRVVVDGVRGGEAREALVLLASRGGGCVLGVRSAADGSAVEHLEALASLGGGTDARLLCAAVHVAVKVARDASGLRRILSISEVSLSDGMSSESVLFEHDGEFRATGASPSF